ncbi:MAG: hypothetical protein LAO30_06940 [Acidobacteriia bacterium]|nr:hypothetical protein [Terriglobia bacterium]
MNLGIENRKQVMTLAVLGGIALLSMAYQFWPSSTATTPVTTQTTATPAKPGTRRTASGKTVPVIEPRLDPTLDLKLLSQSEEIKYAGNGRNIFVAGSVASIEKPKGTGATDHQSATLAGPPPIPPPPPITLKFFGFANKPGETRKVFLSQGEDVFIAAEGDIVDRRYRIVRISPTAVDVEDVLNNNRQSLPLTQG